MTTRKDNKTKSLRYSLPTFELLRTWVIAEDQNNNLLEGQLILINCNNQSPNTEIYFVTIIFKKYSSIKSISI